MEARVIKLTGNNSKPVSFEEAFGHHSNAHGKGAAKFRGILTGGVSTAVEMAKAKREEKLRAKAAADEQARLVAARKAKKAKKAAAAALAEKQEKKAQEQAAAEEQAAYDQQQKMLADQQALYDQQQQQAMMNQQQYAQPSMQQGPDMSGGFDNSGNNVGNTSNRRTNGGGGPVQSEEQASEDWNESPEESYPEEEVEEDDSSEGGSEDDIFDESEDSDGLDVIDGEDVSGLDGPAYSKIDPKFMDIAERFHANKGRVSTLKKRVALGEQLMSETQDHNRRVQINQKLTQAMADLKKAQGILTQLNNTINKKSSADGGKNQSQINMAMASVANKNKHHNKDQKELDAHGGPGMHHELNPKPHAKPPTSSATGLIAVDQKKDVDAPNDRVFDLQFSNAEGSGINMKKTLIGVAVGIGVAGLLIWGLKHYKFIK